MTGGRNVLFLMRCVMKLLLSVACAGSWSEYPSSLLVELSQNDIDRIKQLSNAVSELSVHKTQDSFNGGVWSEHYIEKGDAELDSAFIESNLESMSENELRIDVPMINVKKDAFFFSATPKFCDEDLVIYTPDISIEELKLNSCLVRV